MRLLFLLLLAFTSLANTIQASILESPTYIPVTIYVNTEFSNVANRELYFAIQDAKYLGNVDFYFSESNIASGQRTFVKTVWLQVGSNYSLVNSIYNVGLTLFDLDFVTPAGFSTLVDGVDNSNYHYEQAASASSSNFGFIFGVKSAKTQYLAAGEFSRDTYLSTINFRFGLGTRIDGEPVGALEIIEDPSKLIDSPSIFSNPAILRYSIPDGEEVRVVLAAGGIIKQLRTYSILVVVDSVYGSNHFFIRYYRAGDYSINLQNGVYPINNGVEPYMTYKIEVVQTTPNTGNKFNIYRYYGGESSGIASVKYTFDQESVQYQGQAINAWVLKDSASMGRIETFITGIVNNEETHKLRIINTSAPVAEQTIYEADKVYKTFTSGSDTRKELVRFSEDPTGKNYATYYNFEQTSSDIYLFGKQKGMLNYRGGWSLSTYYDSQADETTGKVHGLPYASYTPFLDETITESFDGVLMSTTSYASYDNAAVTDDKRITRYMPYETISYRMQANTQTQGGYDYIKTGQTTHKYTTKLSAESKQLIKVETKGYASITESFTSIQKFFSPTLFQGEWGTGQGGTTYGGHAFYRSKPYSTITADGVQTSYAYGRATVTIDWSAQSTPYTLTTSSTSIGWQTIVVNGFQTGPTGTDYSTVNSIFSKSIDPILMVDNKSTVTRNTRDGLFEVTESFIFTGGTLTTSPVTWTVIEYLPNGKVKRSRSSDGSSTETTLDSGKRIETITDSTGVTQKYYYDVLGRVWKEEKQGGTIAEEQYYTTIVERTFDAADRVVSTKVSDNDPNTSDTLTSSRQYDMGGKLEKETLPCGSHIDHEWRICPANGFYYREQSTKQGDSRESITRFHTSGLVESVSGSANTPIYYEYSIDPANGNRKVTISNAPGSTTRYSSVTTDWSGRILSEISTGPKDSTTITNTYQYYGNTGVTAGKLWKFSPQGSNPMIMRYDALGQLDAQGLDINNNDSLDETGTDSIAYYTSEFEKIGDDWWITSSSSAHPVINSADKVITAYSKERLSGYTGTLRYEGKSWGINMTNEATTKVDVDTSLKQVISRTEYSHLPATSADVATYKFGFQTSASSAEGNVASYQYDGLGRVISERGAMDRFVAYHYVTNTTLPLRSFEYDAGYSDPSTGNWRMLSEVEYADCGSGQIAWSKDAAGRQTFFKYNDRGQVVAVHGTAASNSVIEYDLLGRKKALYTFNDVSQVDFTDTYDALLLQAQQYGKKTQWDYATGTDAVLKETDPSGKYTSYEYDSNGNMQYMQTARLRAINANYKIEYKYFATGELDKVDYPDSTPDVAYTYGRRGEVMTVSDVTGLHTLSYDSVFYNLSTDSIGDESTSFYGGNRLEYKYDSYGRQEYLQLGTASSVTAHLDQKYNPNATTGRLESIEASLDDTSGYEHKFNYGYEANSNTHNSLQSRLKSNATKFFGQSTLWNRVRNLPVSYTNADPNGGENIAKYSFTYDPKLPRISSIEHTGRLFHAYGATNGNAGGYKSEYSYNDRDELTEAISTITGTAATLSDRYFKATLDDSGNRRESWKFDNSTGNIISTFDNTAVGSPGANNLDQYRRIDGNSRETVTGEAPYWGTYNVSVNGSTAQRPGNGDYFSHLLTVDNSTGAVESTAAVSWNGKSASHKVFMPKDERTFTYDDDGNMTADGVFTYTWDAENRMIQIESTTGTQFKKEFKYDYLSRRVEETYWKKVSGAYQLQHTHRYLYDGFAMIAELDTVGSTTTVRRTFVWGLDITSTADGAGGIGGLLLIHDASDGQNLKEYFPGYDGRGNVTSLVNAQDGSLSASMEYGPWGDLVRATGAWRDTPFLYSTKWSLDQGAPADEHWPIGLYDYGLRYYSPKIGRFISRDPIGHSGGNNLYQAFGGDPVNRSDYLGMDPILTWRDSAGNSYNIQTMESSASNGGGPTHGGGGGYRRDLAQMFLQDSATPFISMPGAVPVTADMAKNWVGAGNEPVGLKINRPNTYFVGYQRDGNYVFAEAYLAVAYRAEQAIINRFYETRFEIYSIPAGSVDLESNYSRRNGYYDYNSGGRSMDYSSIYATQPPPLPPAATPNWSPSLGFSVSPQQGAATSSAYLPRTIQVTATIIGTEAGGTTTSLLAGQAILGGVAFTEVLLINYRMKQTGNPLPYHIQGPPMHFPTVNIMGPPPPTNIRHAPPGFPGDEEENHHRLPRRFKPWFEKSPRNLDIEKFTRKMPMQWHRGKEIGIHSRLKYNAAWRQFISKYPNATKEETINFLNTLEKEFGF